MKNENLYLFKNFNKNPCVINLKMVFRLNFLNTFRITVIEINETNISFNSFTDKTRKRQ